MLAHDGSDGRTRDLLFFFAGGIAMEDLAVSGGARQALYKFLEGKDYPDVLVAKGGIGGR